MDCGRNDIVRRLAKVDVIVRVDLIFMVGKIEVNLLGVLDRTNFQLNNIMISY